MIDYLSMVLFHGRQLLRTPFFRQLSITAPLSFMLLRALGFAGSGAHVPDTLWLSGAVAGLWATTTTAVGMIGYQRSQGTLEMLALSVRRPGVVFGAVAAAAAAIGVVGLPVGWLLQFFLSGRVEVTAPALVGYVVTIVACFASAWLLAALFVVWRSALAFEPIILVPVWLLVGIVIPFSQFPDWLHIVALIHPLSSAVAAANSATLADALGWAGGSLAVSAVWGTLAAVIAGVAMRRARREGSISLS